MTFEERVYRTLVVSASDKFNEAVFPILSESGCDPVKVTNSISSAKRFYLEEPYDFVIINTPLPDENGSKFAIDVSMGKSTVCLLFARTDIFDEIKSKVSSHGVFVLPKPTSSLSIAQGLSFLASARERLRKMEKKSLSIEEKMEEIQLVNRAKWLLIDRLNMAEPDAHRYIEKQAMDMCITKTEVAKGIIRTYLE